MTEKIALPARHPDDMVAALYQLVPQLVDTYQEHFAMICLNDRMEVIAGHLVAIGSRTSTITEPAAIFRHAVVTRDCASIVVAHTHPAGDPTPSQSDLDTTDALIQAGHVMGIPVLDHIVLAGRNSYVSIRQESMRARREDEMSGIEVLDMGELLQRLGINL